MIVNVGTLNKRITILQDVNDSFDEDGFPVEGSKVVRTCWAKVSTSSGSEMIKSGMNLTENKKRFLIRHGKTNITTDMYIQYAGEFYDIEFVNDYEESHEYDEIWAVRRTSNTVGGN